MIFKNIAQSYSDSEAFLHDLLIGNRAVNLHAYIVEHGNLKDVLAADRPQHVLDVGCGGGQLAIHLKETYPQLQLTGIDLSASQISRARRRSRKSGIQIRFEAADAQDLPFPDAHFDVVYSFGSAKHWPDLLEGFSECWRVLKKGGELLIADATSDATREQVENFYDISQFPRIFKKPIVAILIARMFREARSLETYRQIAEKIQMPAGTVRQLPSMPAFLFRTRKP